MKNIISVILLIAMIGAGSFAAYSYYNYDQQVNRFPDVDEKLYGYWIHPQNPALVSTTKQIMYQGEVTDVWANTAGDDSFNIIIKLGEDYVEGSSDEDYTAQTEIQLLVSREVLANTLLRQYYADGSLTEVDYGTLAQAGYDRSIRYVAFTADVGPEFEPIEEIRLLTFRTDD